MTKKKRTKGYPYPIPPFPPHSNIAKNPHPHMVNRFFQIEVLLLSPKVREAYRQDNALQQFMSFFENVRNGDPLDGKHRFFICADTKTPDKEFDELAARFGCVDNYIADLAVIIKRGPSVWWPKGGEAEILQQLRNPDLRFLYLRFDVSRSATPTLEALRPLLEAGHEQYMKSPADNFFDHFYKDTTPFQDFETWRRYFQCYDLQQTTHLTVPKIADQVYGVEDGAVNTAAGALRRVRKVIRFAENQIWPPPDVN